MREQDEDSSEDRGFCCGGDTSSMPCARSFQLEDSSRLSQQLAAGPSALLSVLFREPVEPTEMAGAWLLCSLVNLKLPICWPQVMMSHAPLFHRCHQL